MKRLVLVYGGIAGFVIIAVNTLSLELGHGHVWLGFLVMFIAFSTIFVAIKQHRDGALGGVITFPAAFLLGLGITGLASVVYVLVWEIYLAVTDYAFIDDYVNGMLEASSRSAEVNIEEARLKAEQFRQQYSSPLLRMSMTFVEIFPVGLLVSLFSAAVLRNYAKKA